MNKKNIITASVIAVLSLLLVTSFLWNRALRHKLNIARHNVEASLDSIRFLKDANGKLYAEKKSFIATVKELEELNGEMYANIQSLQKQVRKNLLAGSNIEVVVRDTIYQDRFIEYTPDSLVNIPFSDQTISANSLVRIHRNNIRLQQFTYSVDIPLEVYFTKDYQIIARSKSENVTFSKLNSFIDPSVTKHRNRKRWGLGLQAGIGFMPGYDLSRKTFAPAVGPCFGIGISYHLLQW